jgi:hypothetical protein
VDTGMIIPPYLSHTPMSWASPAMEWVDEG